MLSSMNLSCPYYYTMKAPPQMHLTGPEESLQLEDSCNLNWPGKENFHDPTIHFV